LIIYQGWGDEAVSPLATIQYYKSVVATVTGIGKVDSDAYKSETQKFDGAVNRTGEFARLFMVPGMDHCSGGTGPNVFDSMRIIADWVENRNAPDKIIATHSTNGTVDRSRPLCPYPMTARYSGQGNIDEATNFPCKLPNGN
jgi:feruloyl esterase